MTWQSMLEGVIKELPFIMGIFLGSYLSRNICMKCKMKESHVDE